MYLSEQDLIEIKNQKLSPEQWSQLFVLLQLQVETRRQVEDDLYLTGVSATDQAQIDVKNLAARVERAGDYQTPRKPGILTKSIKLEEVKLSQFDEVTEKCKIFFIADGFKLNVLVDLKPVEHIPLTILASVGQGKWRRERKGRKNDG